LAAVAADHVEVILAGELNQLGLIKAVDFANQGPFGFVGVQLDHRTGVGRVYN